MPEKKRVDGKGRSPFGKRIWRLERLLQLSTVFFAKLLACHRTMRNFFKKKDGLFK